MSFERKIERIEEAETIPLFKGISSWTDLESAINDAPLLTTSDGRPYRLDDLTEGLEIARSTRFTNLNGITSSEGLRETVACLLIDEVENLEELSRVLEKITNISGSGTNYDREDLINKIQAVINNQAEPNTLTRAYNLRDTVTRLLENNLQKAA